jgi:hypothetical protein
MISPIQIAKSTTNSPGGGPTATIGPGHLIVLLLVVGNSTEQHPAAIGDNLGNTYNRIVHVFNSSLFGGTVYELWYAYNIVGGAASFSGSGFSAGGYMRWVMAEYPNISGASDPLDTSGSQTGNTSPSIALSLKQPSELVVGSFGLASNSPVWIWSDLTNEVGGSTLNNVFDSANSFTFGDFQPLTSGSYTVQGYGGSAGQLAGVAAAFKASPSRPFTSIQKRHKVISTGSIAALRAYTLYTSAEKII